jgi:hypothetical protein
MFSVFFWPKLIKDGSPVVAMSEQSPSRITAGLQQARERAFREEPGLFKPMPESNSRVRTIVPDSVDWQELHAGRRLAIAPFLETLIREGRARLVFTEEFTSTCEEKAAAAGIPVEATVKAIFCRDMYSPDDRFVVVASGKGRLSLSSGILPGEHEYSQLEMCKADEIPAGMEFGTCSAFVSKEMLSGIALVAIEDPETELKGKKGKSLGKLGDLEGDFSIGGTDSIAHHLSIRMNYREFAEALLGEYGEKAALIPAIKRI